MRHDAIAYSICYLGFFLSENMLNKIFFYYEHFDIISIICWDLEFFENKYPFTSSYFDYIFI